ncbi:putative monooxygenase p33MONOX [Liparis tanakae]|uniref:Putative monooxygenase p33MONOX n=1 Tax=Liparis tanakae TaxID=230148 RepID=A0A4Z2GYR1_9TELE|nr:putative monooxygenase p33MONOX [Liparis tanakae]
MTSRRGDIPALESGTSSGLFGAFSAPIGMTRRNVSYDELMDAVMHSPPPDMSVNNLWKNPVIPQHKFRKTAEVGKMDGKLLTFEAASPVKPPGPVVKAKATSLMNTLMTKVENAKRGLQGGKVYNINTIHPKWHPLRHPLRHPFRHPFCHPFRNPQCYSPHITGCYTDMGGNEGGGGGGVGGGERWSFFGTRSVVQKSPTDPGCDTSTGFSLQSYFGMQKSSTMDGTNTQFNFNGGDPANFMPPKIEISGIEAKQAPTRPHKLKPRDMNVLTPSGF